MYFGKTVQSNKVKSYNRGLLVAVVIIGTFVAMLNQTVLSVAQPSLITAFGIKVSTAQWLSTGYSLIGGILIPISAWMADRFNTKGLLSMSLALFLAGTMLAFFAGNFPILLAARLVQAVGAEILSGLTMTILFSVFSKAERGTPTMLLSVANTVQKMVDSHELSIRVANQYMKMARQTRIQNQFNRSVSLFTVY